MNAATLDALVVIPARDEEQRIGACLTALARQTVDRDRFATIVVLDACRDRTADVVREVARALLLDVMTVSGPGTGSGPARRVGMELAAERLLTAGRPTGLIASTDADTCPADDWLERQLAHVAAGARAIGGLIELDEAEAVALPASVVHRRQQEAVVRFEVVRRSDPTAEHHHFAGASLGVTAGTYRDVGGIEPSFDLEDAAFARRLEAYHVPVLRVTDVRVRTSTRIDGRAGRGLSTDLAVSSWYERRRYTAMQYLPAKLRAAKRDTTVSVIIPVRECAATVGDVLRFTVAPLAREGLVDEVIVVDAASGDGTAEVAAAAGARVIQQDEVAAELGPALGKGDAMWRAVQISGGEIVCFLDGDTEDPSPNHLLGLLGPLLSDLSVELVKGAFERPLDLGGVKLPHEGGRVTELMARPLLNLHVPLLAGFAQPLAGEFAARRDLLEEIPFPVGYGVEIATLIDALRMRGLQALAECHLGTRQNRHQSLRALGEMAYAVLVAVQRRLPDATDNAGVQSGRYLRPWDEDSLTVPVDERPPIRSLQRNHAARSAEAGREVATAVRGA